MSGSWDIEADWQLLDTCNYRCGYCFFPPARLGAKLPPAVAPDAWQAAFDATGLTWLLHLTGGEPTLLPGFAALCERLSRRHLISLNTNLSHRAVLDLVGRVDPARVVQINAGLHPDERARRNGLGVFLAHAAALREAGFPLIVSLVATPEALAESDAIVRSLAPAGLVAVPKLLRGRWQGRAYPAAYTDAERETFRSMAAAARAAHAPMLDIRRRGPSVDPFADDAFLHGLPDYRGRACDAGRRFVGITPGGDVVRCSRRTRLGNLFDGSFRRAEGPRACDTRHCFYFCERYSVPAAA